MSEIEVAKQATCKRCGGTNVAWVKSNRTGKWYLAFALKYKSSTTYGPDRAYVSPGGITAYTHIPHDCDKRTRGGQPVCEKCGTRHGNGPLFCPAQSSISPDGLRPS